MKVKQITVTADEADDSSINVKKQIEDKYHSTNPRQDKPKRKFKNFINKGSPQKT